MRVAILTVSDRCSRGEAEDRSGPTLRDLFVTSSRLKEIIVTDLRVVADERELIAAQLRELSETNDVVVSTGGTGFGPRDVTPEATLDVIEKRCGGVETALLLRGIQATPLAALSRLVVGIKGGCLVVNLPGSSKAVKEGFEVLEPLLNHAVALLRDESSGH